jgi:hypothetical protein
MGAGKSNKTERRPDMDWGWGLLRKEYRIGDVDATARKACRHFRMNGDVIVPSLISAEMNGDVIVPSLISAVMMSDGKPFSRLVDPDEQVEAESVEEAVDRFITDLPDGDVLARRIIRRLDSEAEKGSRYEGGVPSELAPVSAREGITAS